MAILSIVLHDKIANQIPTEENSSTSTDTASFVSVDHANSIIALSFRGTESLRQYAVDLDMTIEAIPTCSGCQGFTGIYKAWSEVRSQITAAVAKTVAANPGYTVVATGHSLGAGIATFAAAELRQAGYIVDMVSDSMLCSFLPVLVFAVDIREVIC
jgi:hypothetical protein